MQQVLLLPLLFPIGRRSTLVIGHFIVNVFTVIRGGILEGAPQTVPQGKVLTIIDLKIKMVVGVVCTAVDVWLEKLGHTEVVIMDGGAPDINDDKQ